MKYIKYKFKYNNLFNSIINTDVYNYIKDNITDEKNAELIGIYPDFFDFFKNIVEENNVILLNIIYTNLNKKYKYIIFELNEEDYNKIKNKTNFLIKINNKYLCYLKHNNLNKL